MRIHMEHDRPVAGNLFYHRTWAIKELWFLLRAAPTTLGKGTHNIHPYNFFPLRAWRAAQKLLSDRMRSAGWRLPTPVIDHSHNWRIHVKDQSRTASHITEKQGTIVSCYETVYIFRGTNLALTIKIPQKYLMFYIWYSYQNYDTYKIFLLPSLKQIIDGK